MAGYRQGRRGGWRAEAARERGGADENGLTRPGLWPRGSERGVQGRIGTRGGARRGEGRIGPGPRGAGRVPGVLSGGAEGGGWGAKSTRRPRRGVAGAALAPDPGLPHGDHIDRGGTPGARYAVR